RVEVTLAVYRPVVPGAVPETKRKKRRHRQGDGGNGGQADQRRLLVEHFLILEHGFRIAFIVESLQARPLVMADVSKEGAIAVLRRVLVQPHLVGIPLETIGDKQGNWKTKHGTTPLTNMRTVCQDLRQRI